MTAGFIFSLCAGILIGMKNVINKKEVKEKDSPRKAAAKRILKELWYGTGQ